jgi:pyruvate formate lyase activating enzyme
MKRRDFLRAVCLTCGAAGCATGLPGLLGGRALAEENDYRKEALFYEKLPDGTTLCRICPRQCVVEDGKRGYCGVRENVAGTYQSVVYGRVCAYHVDPMEKKPLFHFLPGTTAFSLAAAGCNLDCKFCQNWEISQDLPENVAATPMPPSTVVTAGLRSKCLTIAYTYTEPTVYYEFVLDTARRGHQAGLRSVMISGGYINPEPLALLAKHLDAIKIDLKGFTQEYYENICNGNLQPVLDSIVAAKKSGTWLEIVCLLIPTLNDDPKNIDAMSKWLVENIGTDVPVHFTRFYPSYRLTNVPPTPVATVERARQVALARGLKYVYVGNVPAGHEGESTYCSGCGNVVVKRAGYTILSNTITQGKCPTCGTVVPGIWV